MYYIFAEYISVLTSSNHNYIYKKIIEIKHNVSKGLGFPHFPNFVTKSKLFGRADGRMEGSKCKSKGKNLNFVT